MPLAQRTLALGFTLSSLACVSGPQPVLEVASDGRSAVYRKQRWTAVEGIVFFQRGQELHALSQVPDKPFDLKAEIGADGLSWPADARLQIGAGELRWKAVPASVARRVETGELYPHEDHLHVTHLYANPDLAFLYAAREDASPFPPLRRQVAAAIIAMLVEEKLPASSDAVARAGLSRVDRVLAKVRRGFEGGVPAGALADMLAHDFEIRDDGRVVEVEGRVFRAGDGVRFGYCSGHFHVEDQAARWAHPVEFGEWAGSFTFPSSPLFAVRGDLVVASPGPRQWRALLESGQIQMLRDHWHLTQKFADPSFDALRAAIDDPRGSDASRAKAREVLFELMRLKIDLQDEAAFDRSLGDVREAAARAVRDLATEKR